MKLKKEFFQRNPETVAEELLGKILVRNINGKEFYAKIVETEAYYDDKDPASRACKNGDLKETMKMSGGIILVYGVHDNWLVNIVTGKKGKAEAVLIRAVEPINFSLRCNGPGLLTHCLKIDKRFHKQKIINNNEIWIEESNDKFEIGKSFRIGVTKDLKRHLRFFIKDNKYVSRK